MRSVKSSSGRRVLVVVGVVLTAMMSGCGSDQSSGGGDDPYVIGVIAALTGPAASYGIAEADSAKAVVKVRSN